MIYEERPVRSPDVSSIGRKCPTTEVKTKQNKNKQKLDIAYWITRHDCANERRQELESGEKSKTERKEDVASDGKRREE